MSESEKTATSAAVMPPAALSFFAKPPVLETEALAEFQALVDAVARDINPSGIIEWIWLRDIVHLTWEISRLWRIKAELFDWARSEGGYSDEDDDAVDARAILEELCSDDMDCEDDRSKHGDRPGRARKSTPAPPKKVVEAPKPVSERAIAQSLLKKIDAHRIVDQMIVSAEQRRNNTLREIYFHREILARQLEATSNKIINAQVVETGRKSHRQHDRKAPRKTGANRRHRLSPVAV